MELCCQTNEIKSNMLWIMEQMHLEFGSKQTTNSGGVLLCEH